MAAGITQTVIALFCLVFIPFVAAADEAAFRGTEGALVLSYGLYDMVLMRYLNGELTALWSLETSGYFVTASLADIDGDGSPEVIVNTDPRQLADSSYLGPRSLLIYGNRSGEYVLLLNRTFGEMSEYDSSSRVYGMDYYGNGTRYGICLSHGEMVLIGSRSGSPFVEVLAEYLSQDGFAVGDVNGDGRDDIVHASAEGFTVLENREDGIYGAVEVSEDVWFFQDLKVLDLDGDGFSEIVATACCSPHSQILCVWGLVHGEYLKLWAYDGTGTEDAVTGLSCVEAGDMDGDGLPEMLTPPEWPVGAGGGFSVWEHDESKGSWNRSRDFGSQNFGENRWQSGCIRMAVLDSTGLARGLGVFRYTATSMPILHLVLWEMGEYTHFSLRPQLPAGGALDVWPLVVEPALTAEDLGSLIVEERTHLAQMLDQDLANVLLEVIRAAERLVVDQDLARGGPLVLAVSDALSRSKTLDDSAESKAVIGSLRDASWRAVAEGWYGSIPHILEAGFALADLVDRADEITGGYLLLDHIWEATGLLGTKPTQAMDIAYWCGNEDVRQLARQIHWIKESWGQVEAAVSERNLIVLQGLLTGITDAFADRDTQNCVARMAAFQRQLDQLHVQIIEPACLAPLLPVFLITKSAVKIGIRSLGQARRGDTCRRGPAPRPTAVQASV